DLDASVGSGNVEEPGAVDAANLHVFDRLGLYGKIGSLCPSNRNETRCGTEEKAFHHLHRDLQVCCREGSARRVFDTLEGPLSSPLNHPVLRSRLYGLIRRTGRGDLGMPPSIACPTLFTGPAQTTKKGASHRLQSVFSGGCCTNGTQFLGSRNYAAR